MRNFVQPGNIIPLIAPYDVPSGGGLKVGSIFGVASTTVTSGSEVEVAVEGVYDLQKISTNTFTAGAVVYWDDTVKKVTSTATSNLKIGVAMGAAGNGATTMRVRLHGAWGV
jgi:predicted RecA/RadA family phage recombinase